VNRLQEGLVLGDRYSLGHRIASGGMGDVWAADDQVLSRPVAVKVLRPGTDEEEVFARRFRSEALYTANLYHPNIATVFDYGEDDNLAYLVMELVPGEPLSALVQREGALNPERARAIMGQAALALGAAHEAGVVHRDVKPANILVMPDSTVKLTDFGIARAVDGSGHTLTGEVLGTPHYLSPEQALGEPATGASDLYALGIVAHEMLTGRRPFDKGTPVATALAQVNERPPPLPPHVPRRLRSLIEQCLEKDPANRPSSARELGERLGMPEDELPEASEDAADVVGTAAAAEQAVDDRPAAPPRWTGGADPTPTPTAAVIVVPKGHVHWAWVPGFSAALLVVAAIFYSLAR
jgi:eukaryotic-like serine/threonine-protein kinase